MCTNCMTMNDHSWSCVLFDHDSRSIDYQKLSTKSIRKPNKFDKEWCMISEFSVCFLLYMYIVTMYYVVVFIHLSIIIVYKLYDHEWPWFMVMCYVTIPQQTVTMVDHGQPWSTEYDVGVTSLKWASLWKSAKMKMAPDSRWIKKRCLLLFYY